MRAWRLSLLLVAGLCLALPVGLRAEVQALGPEMRANADEAFRQRAPVAVYGPGGGFFVIWENDQLGIRARRFDAAGQAMGGDLDLVPNARPAASPSVGPVIYRSQPAAVAEPTGGFHLFWVEEKSILHLAPFQEWRENQRRDILGQRFNAQGRPAGPRFRLNANNGVLTQRPAAARFGDALLVVWDADDRQTGVGANEGIFARLVDREGTPLTGPFRVNAQMADKAARAAVAANGDGTFLVAWDACCDGDQSGIFARLLDSRAQPQGLEFRVNTVTDGFQHRPAVTADARRQFLVAWQGSIEEDPYDTRIWGQMLDADGDLLGGEVQISSGDQGGDAQVAPAVTALAGGGFFVAWIDYLMPFPIGAFGVELDALGLPSGAEMEISDAQVGSHFKFAVASRGQGDLLVAYEGFRGEELGISGRRLATGAGRSRGLGVR